MASRDSLAIFGDLCETSECSGGPRGGPNLEQLRSQALLIAVECSVQVSSWVVVTYYNTGPITGLNLGDPKRDHNFDNPPARNRACILISKVEEPVVAEAPGLL